jgi:hypothetical protein
LPNLDPQADEPRPDESGFREIELHDTGEPVPDLDLDTNE